MAGDTAICVASVTDKTLIKPIGQAFATERISDVLQDLKEEL